MKKLLYALLIAGACMVGLVGGYYLQSNGYLLPPNNEGIQNMAMDYADSIVYERLNPTFDNVDAIVDYRAEMAEHMSIDSIFLSLPEKTLIDVATVCINKYGFATKSKIAMEYQAKIDVFSNLPTSAPISNVEGSGVTSVDSPKTVIIGTDYQYRTDTIDGIPRKVLYKTEKSYEK